MSTSTTRCKGNTIRKILRVLLADPTLVNHNVFQTRESIVKQVVNIHDLPFYLIFTNTTHRKKLFTRSILINSLRKKGLVFNDSIFDL